LTKTFQSIGIKSLHVHSDFNLVNEALPELMAKMEIKTVKDLIYVQESSVV